MEETEEVKRKPGEFEAVRILTDHVNRTVYVADMPFFVDGITGGCAGIVTFDLENNIFRKTWMKIGAWILADGEQWQIKDLDKPKTDDPNQNEGNWIHIDDDLPKPNEEVQCWNGKSQFVGYMQADETWVQHEWLTPVSHWMPLYKNPGE
jgi:hypothetical protein